MTAIFGSHLSSQHISFKNLVKRNATMAERGSSSSQEETKIHLPFIIVSTNTSTLVECQMSEDRSDLFLNFSAPFEIHNQDEVLRRMQMHRLPQEELSALIPSQMISYLPPEATETDTGNRNT